MEFRFSDELLASDNPTGGMAGHIPVRRHRYPLREDIGALRAQKDWSWFVGPLKEFRGGLSHKYGLMQVAVPECRPERLEVIAYASEIGFLYDDCTEFFSRDEVSQENDKMQSAFAEGVQNGSIESKSGGLKAMQSILLNEMMTIDQPRAMCAMKVWIEFLQDSAGRQHDVVHKSFDEYMRYRVLDVGEMFWFGLVTFGMALTIPATELPVVRELTRPCWIVLALQNDICSYDKEYEAASTNGTPHLVNALWVLMQERNIDLDNAKEICKQCIEANISTYHLNLEKNRHNNDLSKDARTYMESLLYTISGDAAWSLITPRYNSKQSYNQLQLMMMEYGIDEALAAWKQSTLMSSASEKNLLMVDDQTPLGSTTAVL